MRLAEIAAEEGADLIVIGAPVPRLRPLRARPTLAGELDSATTCPVLLAPRQTRRRSERRLARPVALQSG
jgi:nucleotide-binding universal stress UspA family protein